MIGVKKVKRERGFWLHEGRRVPACAQKLAILVNPLSVPRTCTKLHINAMTSIHVDHNDLSGRVRRWAGGKLMANVEAMAQVVEGCSLEKSTVPNLNGRERCSPVSEGTTTYLKAVQRDIFMPKNNTRGAMRFSSSAVDAPIRPQLLKTVGTLGEGQVFLEAIVTEELVHYYWTTRKERLHLRLREEINTRIYKEQLNGNSRCRFLVFALAVQESRSLLAQWHRRSLPQWCSLLPLEVRVELGPLTFVTWSDPRCVYATPA